MYMKIIEIIEKMNKMKKNNIDSSIVLSSFDFLCRHISNIECCVVSSNKLWIASSQCGKSPDVYIWKIIINKM